VSTSAVSATAVYTMGQALLPGKIIIKSKTININLRKQATLQALTHHPFEGEFTTSPETSSPPFSQSHVK
jgi:hypothetical protein